MPNAVVSIREAGINPTTHQIQLIYNFATDWIDATGNPLSIGDQAMTVNLASSNVIINNGIRDAAIANLVSLGFTSTGLTAADVKISGGIV